MLKLILHHLKLQYVHSKFSAELCECVRVCALGCVLFNVNNWNSFAL